MANGESLGMRHVDLQQGRTQPRGRRADDHLGSGGPAGRGEQALLQLEALGRIPARAPRRPTRPRASPRTSACLPSAAAPASAVGRPGGHARASGPPSAGHPDRDRRAGHRRRSGQTAPPSRPRSRRPRGDRRESEDRRSRTRQTRVRSASFSRTSSGPITRTFIPSSSPTARSTSSALVASRPRDRYRLSSRPTRTFAPTRGASAA